MASARLFFALWPDELARAALAAAVARVARDVTGRPVPAMNYHFTLVFLGSVPPTEIERVCSVAAHLASVGPISVTVDTLEHWRKPQVLVATSTATPPAAAALTEHLTQALIAAGFNPDPRPFRPHLTLARKVAAPFPAAPLLPQRLAFKDFALVESQTRPEGSTYAVLRTFPLS